tara:strand:- start:364 stop:882 length:519 start_codon:yes stop_codon:yes gene_type:complete
MLEKLVNQVFLAIGSNLGNKKHNIEKAKYLLEESENFKIKKTSSYYKTKSWPDPSKPSYYNIVIETETSLDPLNLFYFLKKIERKLGRKYSSKNSPRECDIDILDYNQKCFNIIYDKSNSIIIPHPRMHQRNFVLIPLFEISKKWIHPKFKKKISHLIKQIDPIELRSITVE